MSWGRLAHVPAVYRVKPMSCLRSAVSGDNWMLLQVQMELSFFCSGGCRLSNYPISPCVCVCVFPRARKNRRQSDAEGRAAGRKTLGQPSHSLSCDSTCRIATNSDSTHRYKCITGSSCCFLLRPAHDLSSSASGSKKMLRLRSGLVCFAGHALTFMHVLGTRFLRR